MKKTVRGLRLMKRMTICLCLIFLALTVSSCSIDDKEKNTEANRIRVVVSLYPLYDFAKNIGGERVDVSLLLPPGEEPHSFDPRPADILNLNKADIFIYTNIYMEPWVCDIIKSIDNKKVMLIDSSRGIVFMGEEGSDAPGKEADDHVNHGPHDGDTHDDHSGTDPHVWLDLDNAAKMVDNIRDALMQKDPGGRDYYQKNADNYKASLRKLDMKFRKSLESCKQNIFINGGHFAFGYLAKRYGLVYLSAYGFSPDAEPTPGQIVKITSLLRKHNLKYIYHEELLMPRVARTIAQETGAQLLFLHGAHNINKEDFSKGISFIEIMEKNLENLKKGLECPQK
jgi:zinc transport system substrate-binding protein